MNAEKLIIKTYNAATHRKETSDRQIKAALQQLAASLEANSGVLRANKKVMNRANKSTHRPSAIE